MVAAILPLLMVRKAGQEAEALWEDPKVEVKVEQAR
jgi:hypothetical protein